jgi:predicted enzyme related to lactoylglutathione lyase
MGRRAFGREVVSTVELGGGRFVLIEDTEGNAFELFADNS